MFSSFFYYTTIVIMDNNYLSDIQKALFLFLQNHPSDFNTPIKKVLNKGRTTECDSQVMKNTFFSQRTIFEHSNHSCRHRSNRIFY